MLIATSVDKKACFGAVAQLGERCVRNAEVGGSTPLRSTFRNLLLTLGLEYLPRNRQCGREPFLCGTACRINRRHEQHDDIPQDAAEDPDLLTICCKSLLMEWRYFVQEVEGAPLLECPSTAGGAIRRSPGVAAICLATIIC